MNDAVSYAEVVERAIGNDPQLTAPWLFEKSEVKAGAIEGVAKAERAE